ncbi:MAG TPA: flagellar basal-body rod protein FlgG [Candidatus Goldiibacteriota bacterium]|nr:flagellar basal-body rod protein FlgG [Candidatus Goldiibacteriota bacterium]HRQ44211.1 flagellar basal-body rod protein FlgG [Candidatus Goldiibacteriota bacterium]
MLRSLWTAATGMAAQQTNIDVISNNLSNVNTTAFKKSRAEFQDLLYQTIRPAGVTNNMGAQYPTPIEIGHGARLAATTKSFIQGDVIQTNNTFDLVIQGEGFFQVQLPNGEIAYTRDGSLKMDGSGNLVTSDGYFIEPAVTIPAEATQIVIRENGEIMVGVSGNNELEHVGTIRLTRFANPAGLESIGKNLYRETEATGEPVEGTAGFDGYGTIGQGMLESSNVKVVDEMINLIASQRAYEINAKAIQTSEDMLNIANNLKS